jgi:hypothetical protein
MKTPLHGSICGETPYYTVITSLVCGLRRKEKQKIRTHLAPQTNYKMTDKINRNIVCQLQFYSFYRLKGTPTTHYQTPV